MPDNTFYPNLVRHRCAAGDSENLRECPNTHFTPILFDIHLPREIQRMPHNTFYPDLVRHLCAARDLENTRKHILPQSCSTSMCCERFREYQKTHFTPILFDIDVLRETQRMPKNTFYPDAVRHLCAARDLENARKHILPQFCSTSMCCERLRECPKTHFAPILFDIFVFPET